MLVNNRKSVASLGKLGTEDSSDLQLLSGREQVSYGEHSLTKFVVGSRQETLRPGVSLLYRSIKGED